MASDSTPNPDLHPVVRNALRISLSAKEYKLLHDYAVQRTPSAIQNKLPSPSAFEAIVRSKNKHNEASIRASLRVFVLSSSLLKLVDVVAGRIRGDLTQ